MSNLIVKHFKNRDFVVYPKDKKNKQLFYKLVLNFNLRNNKSKLFVFNKFLLKKSFIQNKIFFSKNVKDHLDFNEFLLKK